MTITRTFSTKITSTYAALAIVEVVHFRDMIFDLDEKVGCYLDNANAIIDIGSFNIGKFPDLTGDESEIEENLALNKAENESNKIGLKILQRKNNTGDWLECAEFILMNYGRTNYLDMRGRLGYPTKLLEKNDALAIQLVDYGDGLLWDTDYIKVDFAATVEVAKKNDVAALMARISALELALEGRLINLPANTLLGCNATTGTVQQIPQSQFATPTQITTAINDLVNTSPVALDTLNELALALGNDANFATTVTNSLATKVDTTNDQSNIRGVKTFVSPIYIKQLLSGANTATPITDSDLAPSIFGKTCHWMGADWTPEINPMTNVSCLGLEFNTLGAVNIPVGTMCAAFFRYRHSGNSFITTSQAVRAIAINSSTGTITDLTAGFFSARNDSTTGAVANCIGGDFYGSLNTAGTATNLIGGRFTANVTSASATTSTLIAGQFIVGSNNTTPATSAIGVDIANITGTATTKIPLKVGTGGSSYFNDTTQSTSTTTGALVIGGGLAVRGNQYIGGSVINFANIPTSPAGLLSGSLWRNGNIINIV